MKNCDEYVLEALAEQAAELRPEAVSALREHLAECPWCAREWEALRETWSLLEAAQQRQQVEVLPSALRTRLVELVPVSSEGDRRETPIPSRTAWLARWSLAAAALLVFWALLALPPRSSLTPAPRTDASWAHWENGVASRLQSLSSNVQALSHRGTPASILSPPASRANSYSLRLSRWRNSKRVVEWSLSDSRWDALEGRLDVIRDELAVLTSTVNADFLGR